MLSHAADYLPCTGLTRESYRDGSRTYDLFTMLTPWVECYGIRKPRWWIGVYAECGVTAIGLGYWMVELVWADAHTEES